MMEIKLVEGVFAARHNIALLRLLAERQHTTFTGRELAENTRFSTGSVYAALRHLTAIGIVKGFLDQGERHYSIDTKHELFPALKEIFEVEKRDISVDWRIRELCSRLLSDLFKALNMNFVAVVFGSYAKGTATPRSDLDLFVLAEEKEGEIERICGEHSKKFGIEIKPFILNFEELEALSEKKALVVDRINRDHILLFFGKVEKEKKIRGILKVE